MVKIPFISILLVGLKTPKVRQISRALRAQLKPIKERVYYNEVEKLDEEGGKDHNPLPVVYINGDKTLYYQENQSDEDFVSEVMKHIPEGDTLSR